MPISVSEWITDCNCGASLDDSGYHLLTCKTGGGPVWSHESVASVWSDCLKNLNIPHRREPQHRYMTSENRPDIVVFDSQRGANIELDVALAHPWSSDIFPKSSDVDGAAAKRREDRKEDKYKKERLPGGSQVNMIPLVMEHFGRWGKRQGSISGSWHRDPQMESVVQMLQNLWTSGENASQFNCRDAIQE